VLVGLDRGVQADELLVAERDREADAREREPPARRRRRRHGDYGLRRFVLLVVVLDRDADCVGPAEIGEDCRVGGDREGVAEADVAVFHGQRAKVGKVEGGAEPGEYLGRVQERAHVRKLRRLRHGDRVRIIADTGARQEHLLGAERLHQPVPPVRRAGVAELEDVARISEMPPVRAVYRVRSHQRDRLRWRERARCHVGRSLTREAPGTVARQHRRAPDRGH
jgi:hypothetical protein